MNKPLILAIIMTTLAIATVIGATMVQIVQTASAANRVSEEAKPLAELISRDARAGGAPVNDEATTIGPAVRGVAQQQGQQHN